MNIFELLIFLFVTTAAGAATGLMAGFVAGAGSRWAAPGALAGPVVAALGITVWCFVTKVRKPRQSKVRSDEKGV